MAYPIRYQPEALALGDKPKFVSATDGDTPTIQVPIRMLGMDAPELHYAGAGLTRAVTSVITPSVPSEPTNRRVRS